MHDASAGLTVLPFITLLRLAYDMHPSPAVRKNFIQERFLKEPLLNSLHENGAEHPENILRLLLTLTLIKHNLSAALETSPAIYFDYIFTDTDIQNFTGVNSFENNVYFNKERFEEILDWLTFNAMVDCVKDKSGTRKRERLMALRQKVIETAEESEYKLESLLNKLAERA
jgi:hypothetical protein